MQCYRCGTHAYRLQGNRMCCQVRLRTKVLPLKAERQWMSYLKLEDLVGVNEVVAEKVLRPKSAMFTRALHLQGELAVQGNTPDQKPAWHAACVMLQCLSADGRPAVCSDHDIPKEQQGTA